jgi:hypothetical protein
MLADGAVPAVLASMPSLRALAVLLLTGCAIGTVDLSGFGPPISYLLQSAIEGACAHGSRGKEPERDLTEVPVEQLMERSRLLLARDGGACEVTAERSGAKTWRVDSCEHHLSCFSTHWAEYTCNAPP